MIEINNVSKYYPMNHGWRKILDDLHLTIPNDINLGVLGRNGAGKSTLLRLISGLELPDSGNIQINSRRLSWPLGTAAGIHGSLTGRENIRFIVKLFGENYEKTCTFVEEFAELNKYLDMPVKTYSSGMRSRLAFGISMGIEFDTYLIDEGFSVGDAKFRSKTEGMFKERLDRSNMIVVSHNPSTIKKFCNRIAVLHNGGIQLYDNIEEGIERYTAL